MPLRLHARTVALARLLRTIGGVRKTPGKVPRQQQPDTIRLEYYSAIRRAVVAPLVSAYSAVQQDVLQLLIQERRQQGRVDVARSRMAVDMIDKAAAHVAKLIDTRELNEIARRFGRRTSEFNRAQLDKQLRSAIGVPLSSIERPMRDPLPGFVADNVSLIKTITDRYHSRVRASVSEAFDSGMHPETLADRLQEIDDISDSDAIRIARDQIGKLNGQFNEIRQQAMGVTSYVWRTARDNRVRDEHSLRDGQTFRWDDPPEDGHPGEAIQCRCFSEPVFDEILADL